jgi:hypothetical protein
MENKDLREFFIKKKFQTKKKLGVPSVLVGVDIC